jgi:uncharacterized protein YkwD
MADDMHVGRRTALVGCVVALLVAAVAPSVADAASGSRTTSSVLETGILGELNDIRVAHGLRPLRRSTALTAAAQQHTVEMIEDGYFEHESANGSPFWQRVERYYPQGANAWEVGENLIWCSPTLRAKRAVELWMDSPGHRANILSPKWREIGIAAVHSSTSTGEYGGGAVTVITTDFGVR